MEKVQTERKRTDIFRVMKKEQMQTSKADIRSRRFFFPERILWTAGQVENSQVLLKERDLQISLTAHNPCILKNKEGEKASMKVVWKSSVSIGVVC